MTDRTTKVTLLAQVEGYVRGFELAQQKTRELGSAAEQLAQKRQALQQVGTVLLGIGTAAAAGVALATWRFAEFDKAMSNVNAITQETAGNQQLLRDAALEAGAATVFTATESANAIEELAKAGLTTEQILGGGLTGALDLASSAQLGVARAAEISATTMKQFGLDGSQAARVADVLSAGANKALGSVDDLAAGLKFVGPVSKAMGISLEDTTATLALFADQGILGEQAGTALRGMLASLQAPSAAAKKELERLGIQMYDSQGAFVGLEPLIGQLNSRLGDATAAERDASLGIIFTNAQLTTAQALVGEAGDQWGEYRDAVEDAGIAQRIASDRLDNLSGDVEKLGGAMDTALIKTGSNANDVMRFMVQWATDAVDVYNDLPEPLQAVALGAGVLTAAVTIGYGAFLLGVPKVVEYREALATLGPTAQRTGRILGAMVKGAGIIGAFTVVTDLTERWADSMVDADGKAKMLSNSIATNASEMRGFGDVIDHTLDGWDMRWAGIFATSFEMPWNAGNNRMRDIIESLGDELAGLSGDELAANFTALREEAGLTDSQLMKLIDSSSTLRDSLVDQATKLGLTAEPMTLLSIATGENAAKTETAADAYLAAKREASGLQTTLEELIGTIMEANAVGVDAVSKNLDYKNALADVDDVIRQAREGIDQNKDGVADYTLTLDESTRAGRENYQMLLDTAQAGWASAEAQFAMDGNLDAYLENLRWGRETILQNARDLGATDEQVQYLAEHILALPSVAEVAILAETQQAQQTLDEWFASNSGRRISVVIDQVGSFFGSTGGTVPGFAGGGTTVGLGGGVSRGTVWGWGGPKDDKVTIRVSPGEEIVQEPYASQYRSELKAMNAGVWQPQQTVPEVRYIPMGQTTTAASAATQRVEGAIRIEVVGTDGLVEVSRMSASQELADWALELAGGAA